MYWGFRKIIIAYFSLYISSWLYLFTLSMLFNFSFTLNFNPKYKATAILFKHSSSFFQYRIIELLFFLINCSDNYYKWGTIFNILYQNAWFCLKIVIEWLNMKPWIIHRTTHCHTVICFVPDQHAEWHFSNPQTCHSEMLSQHQNQTSLWSYWSYSSRLCAWWRNHKYQCHRLWFDMTRDETHNTLHSRQAQRWPKLHKKHEMCIHSQVDCSDLSSV